MTEHSAPLGILGGTFDPIHFGHLRLAQDALNALGLAAVRFIPAGQPAHRDMPGASAEHRLAMTRCALQGCAQFELDPAEAISAAPSYTVPTLERLRRELGEQRALVLLLGTDAFLGLTSWHRWRDLFDLAHIAVATRPGYALTMGELLAGEYEKRRITHAAGFAASPSGNIFSFEMTPLDISASAIRAQFGTHRSPRFLLPDAVLDYIEAHSLYT